MSLNRAFGIRQRLACVILIAAIPVALLLRFLNLQVEEVSTTDAQYAALRQAVLISREQTQILAGVGDILSAVAILPAVSGDDVTRCADMLVTLVEKLPKFLALAKIAPNGDIGCASQSLRGYANQAGEPTFRQALESREFAVSGYAIGDLGPGPIVKAFYPEQSTGQEANFVLVAALGLGWLSQTLEAISLDEDAEVAITDAEGTVLAHYPGGGEQIGRPFPDSRIRQSLQQGIRGVAAGLGFDGKARLYGLAPLAGSATGATISISVLRERVLARYQRAVIVNLAGIGGTTVVLLLLAWTIAHRGIVRPVRRLQRVTQRLRDGDLTARVGASLGGEIGTLGDSIDDMAESLERRTAERQRAEAQLLQAQKMEALGQLTGGVAHDFNNLLAIIRGNLELLSEEMAASPRVQRYLNPALHAAGRGAELTRRLLAFSRHRPLQPVVTDLNQLVGGMVEILRRTLGETIRVESRLEPDLGLTRIDPGQFENALLNLAINARDAMPGGGSLTVATANRDRDRLGSDATPARDVVLTVTDSGSGMAPEVVGRAFEPFYTTKEAGRGSGLGLSMVYDFVTQAGGRVEIDSEPGRGTTVSLFLPEAAPGGSESDDDDGCAMVLAGRGELLLLVEDDPDVRDVIAAMLGALGYRALKAEDSRSAFSLLERHPDIAVLIVDFALPEGLGHETLVARVRNRRPDIKVLFISGRADDRAMAAAEPGMAFLAKPFARAELARRLRRLIEGPVDAA